MINYSVIFTNDLKQIAADLDKYLCFDNKIHVRFKDFNKEEFIIGFEKKLTYLLSYLINYCYIPKLIGEYSDKDIKTSFILDDDTLKIIQLIQNHIGTTHEFAGILIKPNYKRNENNYKYFGDTDIRFFPQQIKNSLTEVGNLDLFLSTFKLDLYDYLFDDNYVIWLHNKEFKVNDKFDKRKLKRINKKYNKNINIVELW